MSAEEALDLVLVGALAAGSLTARGGGGIAATTADTKAGATTTAGGAKVENDAAVDTTTAGSGEKRTLRVAMECAYASYSWTQPDGPSGAVVITDSNKFAYGCDAMMARKVCEELDYDLGIVRLDRDSLIPVTITGQADCVITRQFIISGRLQAVDFTEPYYHTTVVTPVEKGGKYADARGVTDLAGATCTSQQSTIWYNTCLPQIQDANVLVAIISTSDMLMPLNADKCDLVVADQSTGRGVLITYPNFKMIEFDGGDANFQVMDEDISIGISLKRRNTELKDAINSVLTKTIKDDFSKMMDEIISVQLLAN